MASLLSNLVDNLSDNHKTKCKYEHDTKNANIVELNTNTASAVLNTPTLKMI